MRERRNRPSSGSLSNLRRFSGSMRWACLGTATRAAWSRLQTYDVTNEGCTPQSLSPAGLALEDDRAAGERADRAAGQAGLDRGAALEHLGRAQIHCVGDRDRVRRLALQRRAADRAGTELRRGEDAAEADCGD